MNEQDNILEQLEAKLKELRQYFFENADAVGPYFYTDEDPNIECDNGAPVFRYTRGTLHIIQFKKPVECWFTHEGTADSYRWPLEWFERNVHRLDIFGTWSYSDGTYTGTEHFDKPAHWFVRPETSIELEKICQTIEDLIHSLNDAKYQNLTKQISKAIRSENPQWVQTTVLWSYIKDLDWAIKAVADFERLPKEILTGKDKLDEIDNTIILLYQESEKKGIKLPSCQKIAETLHKANITNKKYSQEGIRKRIIELRKAGHIGDADDNKDRADRFPPDAINSMEESKKIKQKF